jgi:hypothetical protein
VGGIVKLDPQLLFASRLPTGAFSLAFVSGVHHIDSSELFSALLGQYSRRSSATV